MYLRSNMLTADPSKIDDGLTYIREQVVPVISKLPGYRGLVMTADRSSGDSTIVSFWDDLESLRASEATVSPLRKQGSMELGGALTPSVLEVAERRVHEETAAGSFIRLSELAIAPGEIDKSIDIFRSSTLPALEAMPGFCVGTLAVDRKAGRGVAATVWRDKASMEASRERATGLRQEVADKSHGTIKSVQEHEVLYGSIV